MFARRGPDFGKIPLFGRVRQPGTVGMRVADVTGAGPSAGHTAHATISTPLNPSVHDELIVATFGPARDSYMKPLAPASAVVAHLLP
jgi:hypothetical protein